ncbi:chorismate--pyruvate lyase family protein [Aliikangiella sp. IMCC44632]
MNSQILSLLSDRGSLTGRFKQVMGAAPQLTKLNQGKKFVSAEERILLEIPERQYALVREIKMGNQSKNWLFARTTIPLATLQGGALRISMLNNEPIGKILFGRNGAERTFMNVELTTELPPSLAQLNVATEQPLWMRRSIFEFDSGPLLISEVFLPDCPIYNDTLI